VKKRELGFLLLRLTVALGLLALIFLKLDRTGIQEALTQLHPLRYLLAVLSFTLVLALSTARWMLFLRIYPEKYSFGRLFSAYFVGLFAANYLPSGGIDLARGLYLVPETDRRAPIFASILVDRLSGFVAILLIVIIGLPFGLESTQSFAPYLWGFAFVLPVTIGLSLHPKVYSTLKPWVLKLPMGQHLQRFYDAYMEYRKTPKTLTLGLLLSLAIQFQFVLTAWLSAWSIGIVLPILKTLFFVSIVNLLAMIPITISGIGVREGGFVALFHGMMTPEQSVAVSLLYFGTSLMNSLVGLPLLLRIRLRRD